eukprot:tig00000269_g23691.t1
MSDIATSSSTEGRTAKRARLESRRFKSEAAAAVDALPDAVMSSVFKTLGLRSSWPLRGVCRRWQRVVEETEWASIDVDVDLQTETASYLSSAIAALPGRKLRLSDGASVSLLSNLDNVWFFEEAHQNNQRRIAAALHLLLAIQRSHSGRAQPRSVSIAFDSGGEAFIDKYPSDNGDVVASFSSYLLGVLRALAPQDGSASRLESLSVSFAWRRTPCGDENVQGSTLDEMFEDLPAGEAPWPAGADLQAALAPFRGLRSLALVFDDALMGVSREAATVIAATCPLLRSVSVSLRPFEESSDQVLAALARLVHLEELVVEWAGDDVCPRSFEPAAGLAALADGPAGRSLRRIAARSVRTVAAASKAGPLAPVVFPTRYEDCESEPLPLSDGVLRALGRMPRLEYVEGLKISADDGGTAARALGRLTNLREARLDFNANYSDNIVAPLRALAEAVALLPHLEALGMTLHGSWEEGKDEAFVEFLGSAGVQRALTGLYVTFHVRDAATVRGFAAALSRLPRLARLSLFLSDSKPSSRGASALGAEHFAALLASDGARRALTTLQLSVERPLAEAEAKAILALPALERLELSAHYKTDVPLRPFEMLRGLRPEVELRASLHLPAGYEAAKEAVQHLFAGRPSTWLSYYGL